MADDVIRIGNVAMRFKLETIEGVDASPTATDDAFPFEEDGYGYTGPWTNEASREANGSMVAGAPLIIGQPATITIPVRMKGANAPYSASVKPPHHALLAACGKRGLFTSAVSSAALTAGTTTSGTLGTGFGTTAQMYRGMPLLLSGGSSGGRTVFVTDYSAAKVATLTDTFGVALSTSVSAALLPNWTYAGTSPKDASARLTDHPSGTLYLDEDGVLHKWFGCRGRLSEWGGNTARPGYMTFQMTGIYGGRTDSAMPSNIVVPQQGAPVLAMGASGVNPAMLVNRKGLPISQWSINEAAELENPDDPNTAYGFGAGAIGERMPELSVDPLATLVATRNILAEIEAGAIYPGVLRSTGAQYNRWAITLPQLQPMGAEPGARGMFRSEQARFRALNPGIDANTRDGESILCFY